MIPIQVDGKTFQATENLEMALRKLRCQVARTLWVNAICINQQDDVEKSHQVRRMKQIYEEAEDVMVWLGPEFEDSDLALNKLHSLGESASSAGFVPPPRRLLTSEGRAIFEPLWKCWFEEVKDEHQRFRDAVVAICHRAWWRRIWAIRTYTILYIFRILTVRRKN